MNASMSRKSFLLGAGLAGASVVAVGMAGCAPGAPAASDADALAETGAAAATDWLGEAPALSPEDCARTVETDVLVVGAGISGSMSAYGALGEGVSVIVIDKHRCFHYGGNGASFVNSQSQLAEGMPEYDPYEILYQGFNETQSRADISLWMPWVFKSGEICDELIAEVAEPYGCPYVFKKEDLAFDRTYEMQCNYGTGVVFGDLNVDNYKPFLTTLHSYIEDKGGEFVYSTRAQKVVLGDDGSVEGIIATDEGGENVFFKTAKGVIMATGSYGSNREMCEAFLSPTIQELFADSNIYNSYFEADEVPEEALDTGDGHKMLCWAGAVMEEATHGYNGWPLSGPLGSPYLSVNQMGNRFMNETLYMLNSLQQVAEQPNEKGIFTWQIISNEEKDVPNVAGVPAPVLQMFIENGETYEADTIRGLAEQIDIDPDVFETTVNRYNELCDQGFDADYGKRPDYMVAIKTPPFKAVRVNYGVAITTGGVICNNKLEVLDERQQPIPGLYAAGNLVGRRLGWAYQNRHNGMNNSFSITHGYLAGHNCGAR